MCSTGAAEADFTWFLSVFGGGPVNTGVRPIDAKMSDMHEDKEIQNLTEKRYEENAPGPFYVVKDMCIICCAPEDVAPDLMGFYTDPTGTSGKSHCYFRKQPINSGELERAINALRVACCGALRYEGNDPKILRCLNELGLGTLCDKGQKA